ncbi:hypothetical protein RYX36_025908 [Vicia faba]
MDDASIVDETIMEEKGNEGADADMELIKGTGVGTKKSKRSAKDPNNPKRPPSAFFIFMYVSVLKNRSIYFVFIGMTFYGEPVSDFYSRGSAMEKAPYVATTKKKKEEYEKAICAYNISLAEGKVASEEEGSDKSMSEVNDEDDDDDLILLQFHME